MKVDEGRERKESCNAAPVLAETEAHVRRHSGVGSQAFWQTLGQQLNGQPRLSETPKGVPTLGSV